ncbi:MAG: Na+/H+ antiporter NhaC family protein [candidate division KSB1 bacterium]|nr:Na+/H+ antiporter NhaC family protein [candidate division KSB1 bacterium]
MTISVLDDNMKIDNTFNNSVNIDGVFLRLEEDLIALDSTLSFTSGTLTIDKAIITSPGKAQIRLDHEDLYLQKEIRVIPGILSLLPPILAIILALLLKQVLIALFSGIWLGAVFINDYHPLTAFLRALDTYIINSLSDPSHAAIVIFSMTLGGMVGVMSKAGGTEGIVKILSRFASNRRGGQISSWAMGLLIFFDDYANTLIVGNTMRPFTDKLQISREKLSYIVDSTAAPVASIAIISSWVGFQIGLIDQAFKSLNISQDAYITFIQSVPFSSYSILAIFFVFLIGMTLRDFSSMRKSESRAYHSGKVLRDNAQPLADAASLDIKSEPGTPLRWLNAMIPILTVIIITLMGLYYSGMKELAEHAHDARLGEIIGAANSFHVLMWASFTGALVAIGLATMQKILSLADALSAWLNGVKAMLIAMIILVLAWAIGDICNDLKTADYVINLIRSFLSPHYLPVLTFIVAAFIGFSTGTSWATMAILVPIVIPAAYKLSIDAGMAPELTGSILLGTIGAVLSGSVFGDHCSPISDTTIMSSMASAADHIDHVRTQLPYAVIVAGVACVTGYIPCGFGISPWLSIMFGCALLIAFIFLFGRKVTDSASEDYR